MDLERRVRRAREILTDEMITDAMHTIEQAIFTRWKASKTPGDREAAWNELRGLQAFRQHFENVLNTGKLELPKENRKTNER